MRDPFPYFSLGATLLLLLLDAPVPAAVAIGALGVVALARPPRRRETVILASGLLLAAALLGAGAFMTRYAATPAWSRSAAVKLDALLDRLDGAAGRAHAAVADLSGTSRRVDAFDRLSALAADDGGDWSYLLFDQDGEAVAWSGEGLLHDVDPLARRREETGFVSSYTATTLYTLRAAQDGANTWWIAAGRSFPRDRLPFSPGPLLERRAYRWWIERDEGTEDPAGDGDTSNPEAVGLSSSRGFSMRVARQPEAALDRRSRPLAAMVLGVALLLAALDRARAVARGGVPAKALVPALVAERGSGDAWRARMALSWCR